MARSGSPFSSRAPGLLLVLGLALALRIAFVTSQSLWMDEGYTLEFADTRSLHETFRLVLASRSTERFSPLYPVLLHGLIQWLNDSVIVLRGLSVVCGVAAVFVLMQAARSLFDRPTAWLAGALASISAFAVWTSQDARPYGMMILLVSLQLWALAWCLAPAPATPRPSRRWALALASGVGLWGNVLFAFSSASLSVADAVARGDRRRWWRLWWPAAAASLPAALFFATSPVVETPMQSGVSHLHQNAFLNVAYTVYGQIVGITFGPPQASLRNPDKLVVLRQYAPELMLAGLLAILLLVVVAVARRERVRSDPRWTNHAMLGISLVIGTVLSITFVLVTQLNWQPRHAYFLFPPAVLFIAFSLRCLAGCERRALRGLALGAILIFGLTNLWGIYNAAGVPKYGKDDYRGVAHVLRQAHEAGEPSALLYGKAVLLRFYGDSTTVDLSTLDDRALFPRLMELARPTGQVLVAINREFYWREAPAAVVLDSAFVIRDHQQLQYFDVYRLSPRH